MKFNIAKKLFLFVLCVSFLFCNSISIEIFADLKDISIQGGKYEDVLNEVKRYKGQHPEDLTVYECHHLIAKGALNKWGSEISRLGLGSRYNSFLVRDERQNWGPSIVMEKTDHEQTLSYYNELTRTEEQNREAVDYIESQADRIIQNGDIIGVLKDECKFIRETFGHKYDMALDQVWFYINGLSFRHPEYGRLTMVNPCDPALYFSYRFSA